MKKTLLFTLLLTFSFNIVAQNKAKIDSLKSIINKSNKKDTLSHIYSELADQYIWSYPDSAFLFADKGLEIAIKQNFIEDEAECLRLKSLALALNGEYTAVPIALLCIDKAEEFGIMEEIISAKRNYGQVLYWLKEYPMAKEQFNRVLNLCIEQYGEPSKDSPEFVKELFKNVYLNIGQTEYWLSPEVNDGDARHYIKKASLMDNKAWYVIQLFEARLSYREGKYNVSESGFRDCINVHENDKSSDNVNNLTAEYVGLSKSCFKQGKKQDAINYATIAYNRALNFTNPNYQLDAANWNAELHDSIGQDKIALKFLKIAKELNTKYLNKVNEQKLNNLNEKYHQEQEKSEQEKEENRHHNLVIIFLITSLLFLLWYYRIARNNKIVKILVITWLFMFFEFLHLVMHKYIGNYVHHDQLKMLFILIMVAVVLTGVHHPLQKWAITNFTKRRRVLRNKQNQSNKLKIAPANQTNLEAKP
jgi:tetratricopeptide (TPR) repeat protein